MNNSKNFQVTFEIETDGMISEYEVKNVSFIPSIGEHVTLENHPSFRSPLDKIVFDVKNVEHHFDENDAVFQHVIVRGSGWLK